MTKPDKSKIVATTLVLALQLREWVAFARGTGAMNQKFKYLSGMLLTALDNILNFMFQGQEHERNEAYEQSVKISEVVTELIELDDEQQRRVFRTD